MCTNKIYFILFLKSIEEISIKCGNMLENKRQSFDSNKTVVSKQLDFFYNKHI